MDLNGSSRNLLPARGKRDDHGPSVDFGRRALEQAPVSEASDQAAQRGLTERDG